MQVVYSFLLEATEIFVRYSAELSFKEYRALLWIASKGEASVTEVASFLQVPSSTASRIIDQLDVRGSPAHPGYQLIEVIQGQDRRQKLVRLSEKGEALFRELTEMAQAGPQSENNSRC